MNHFSFVWSSPPKNVNIWYNLSSLHSIFWGETAKPEIKACNKSQVESWPHIHLHIQTIKCKISKVGAHRRVMIYHRTDVDTKLFFWLSLWKNTIVISLFQKKNFQQKMHIMIFVFCIWVFMGMCIMHIFLNFFLIKQ